MITIGDYEIEHVPIAEALQLRADGVIMYDYTKLTAANTCPTFGVLRYGLHKTEYSLDKGGRNLAIECGKACHDYFAALRMWTLLERHEVDELRVTEHAFKMFGKERWNLMRDVPQDGDRVNNAMMFALDALHTTGYYDDPSDRRRTMSNMEASCLVYSDRYFKANMPVYVQDDLIGVEIAFVVRVRNMLDDTVIHYCGKIDGVHMWEDKVVIAENKTAGQLNDAWRMAFAISNQVTGYTVAASCIFNKEIDTAIVMGVQVPPPKDIFTGTSFELCTRSMSDKERWCEWLFHSAKVYDAYVDNPTDAPRYSHSCNRYFSACQFIPYCSLPRDEQMQALEDMNEDVWSPLDHVVEKEATEGA